MDFRNNDIDRIGDQDGYITNKYVCPCCWRPFHSCSSIMNHLVRRYRNLAEYEEENVGNGSNSEAPPSRENSVAKSGDTTSGASSS
ncbi:hypothetical protein Q1695_001537 [Nippostrongylus brasiliensis]|nr:hypothetical protein Q1695_001537 [Nippostrongylus brasiliensis]